MTQPLQTKFALTLVDGSLAIMSFITKGFNSDGSVQFERDATDENLRAEFKKASLDVASYRPIVDADLPPSRDYRNAWIDTGKGPLKHDMAKARGIHRDRIRVQRKPRFVDLDSEALRAIEDGDAAKLAGVKTAKQKLRDAPADPRIDNANNVAALAALTLDVLVQ